MTDIDTRPRFDARDLRNAVDDLTQPTRTRITQLVNGTTYTRNLEQEPLLTQLEAAIHGSMRSGSGASSNLPGETIPLDGDALYRFTIISTQIVDWCRLAGLPRPAHPIDGLRAWQAATLATLTDPTWHVHTLRGWVGEIRNGLLPPREKQLLAACYMDECGATTYLADDDQGRPVEMRWPLRFRWRDRVQDGVLVCLACGSRWVGELALQAGAYATAERDAS
ncbi:DUF7341 domain-containing protein [Microbacterium telephonicum]|uniref:DUF7341 domain-containing protein n=1 Tax=Microbacterium telephonicum TaxID=1714841 RepID=A0A498BUX9_9MICO|nr:hypothetical protein [Microbacterium telephonicum]RLK47633.1 hypothetical protein C7474_2228 [Microbacterium telephonicum]